MSRQRVVIKQWPARSARTLKTKVSPGVLQVYLIQKSMLQEASGRTSALSILTIIAVREGSLDLRPLDCFARDDKVQFTMGPVAEYAVDRSSSSAVVGHSGPRVSEDQLVAFRRDGFVVIK